MGTTEIVIGCLLILIILGGMKTDKINKYIETHSMPLIEEQAMKDKAILKGMNKEQVEIVFGKGKVISVQGYPAYTYQDGSDEWTVFYDEDNEVISAEKYYRTYQPIFSQPTSDTKLDSMIQNMREDIRHNVK